MNPANPIHITVAGPIGSGKTTLVKKLTNLLSNSALVNEPLDMNVLTHFLKCADIDKQSSTETTRRDYSDSAFSFQMSMLTNRFAHLILALNKPDVDWVISDQGLLFDTVFASLHEERFTEEEYKMYEILYKNMNRRASVKCKETIIVYLNESIEVCKERVKQRNRPGEINTYINEKPNYISDLKKRMDSLIKKLEDEGNCTILKITIPQSESESEYSTLINAVVESLKKQILAGNLSHSIAQIPSE